MYSIDELPTSGPSTISVISSPSSKKLTSKFIWVSPPKLEITRIIGSELVNNSPETGDIISETPISLGCKKVTSAKNASFSTSPSFSKLVNATMA